MDGLMSGEVAAQAKVHVETLRYYERRGLIAKPPIRTRCLRMVACSRRPSRRTPHDHPQASG